jgi:hypothetical protein
MASASARFNFGGQLAVALASRQRELNATYFATNALASGPTLALGGVDTFASGTRWHLHVGRNKRSAATAPHCHASRLECRNSAARVTAYNSESKWH